MSAPVHVMPRNDIVEHEFTDCPCGPTEEAVFRDDGSNGWIVVHHSLDGREADAAALRAAAGTPTHHTTEEDA